MTEEEVQLLRHHIAQKHSINAINGYLNIIKRYLNYCTQNGLDARQSTYPDVLEYIGVLRQKGLHPKTLHNQLYAIKMYYAWLLESGQRSDHPCYNLFLKDKINRAIPLETLLSKSELDDLLQSHRAKLPLTRNRDKIVLSLLIRQAITVTEIVHIQVHDIDLRAATLHLKGTTKTMARLLPLRSEQIMLMNDYLQRTRPLLWKNNKTPRPQDQDCLILSSRGRQMKPISITGMFARPLSNDTKITPQKIRQSVIANLLKSGKDLRVIQAFTGHKTISSIEQYRQTGLEELKIAIEQKHPYQR